MKQVKLFFSILFLLNFTQLSQAQTCNLNVPSTTPNSRYVMSNDGTVLDKQTGLTWKRCSEGQIWEYGLCTGSFTYMDWETALQTAENTVFAGKNDWRVPNLKELYSLIEERCHSPAINTTAFPYTPIVQFLSSTPDAKNGGYMWFVNFCFYQDRRDYKTYGFAVRLVRGG
jgi:Protein of unknown function (DUF1566)